MRFGIVSRGDNFSLDYSSKLVDELKRENVSFELNDAPAEHLNLDSTPIDTMKANVIIAVGDDGTVLHTFNELKREIPVLAINTGNLGFLTEMDATNPKVVVKKLLSKDYKLEHRARLSCAVDGKQMPDSLNEVGIFPSKSALFLRYSLSIDDVLAWRDGADGLLISTPTGSTAYSLSAGGPIISGNSEVFEITPICSGDQSRRCLVVPDSSKVTISGLESSSSCEIVIDGWYRAPVSDSVILKKANASAVFVRSDIGYTHLFGKLKKKREVYSADVMLVKDLPSSAKLIYKVLQYEGSLTQKEILKLTSLPQRTVRHAMNILLKRGLVSQSPNWRDIRQKIYSVGRR